MNHWTFREARFSSLQSPEFSASYKFQVERVKRTCAIATEALKEAKKAKRSLILEDNCALRLRNCKTSVTGGHRLSSTEASCPSCFMTTFRGRDYENGFLLWKKKAMDGQTHIRSEQFVKRFVNVSGCKM